MPAEDAAFRNLLRRADEEAIGECVCGASSGKFLSCREGFSGTPPARLMMTNTIPLRVMRTVTLRVAGMHCSGCEQTIEQALAQVPGVHRVKASYVT
jgi:hypothetical protein